MLTSKAKYALRAMIDLAAQSAAGHWSTSQMIGDIARRQEIPRRFLENILLELRRHELVVSHRGKNGGYALARSPKDITFAHVIRAIDGPLALAPCASLTNPRRCEDCTDDEAACMVRHTLMRARAALGGVLDTTTLADAAGGSKAPLKVANG
jgi:Rrf2 family protein